MIGFALFMTSTISNEDILLVDGQTTSSSTSLTSLSPSPSPPTSQITSHKDGQQVTEGELTLEGISSDNEEIDCQVYADVNDMTPMRNETLREQVILEIPETFRNGFSNILNNIN